MKLVLIIPVYNEAAYLHQMLTSLVSQTLLPEKVVLVNDHSTDESQQIIDHFSKQFDFIESVYNDSEDTHSPGAKVISAFYKGFNVLNHEYDLIGKFDADLELPTDYLERIVSLFKSSPRLGMASGNLYIQEGNQWVYEAISEKTKVRGPLKIYRKECFQDIGGLKPSIGWDTVDELLARYHGWEIQTDPSLHVKHLKPTGASYSKNARFLQGASFKKMRYGFWLSLIASMKLGMKKKSVSYFFDCLRGYFKAPSEFIVTPEEGAFIRKYRWANVKKKLF